MRLKFINLGVLFCVALQTNLFAASIHTHYIKEIKQPTNEIALTFDDGPKAEYAPAILDILDHYGVRATFFLVGKEAELNPDLVYRIYSSGHEVANHTYSHKSLDSLSPVEIEQEIASDNEILKKVTGQTPKYFRPPHGRYNQDVLAVLEKLKMTMILWNLNGGDYVADNTFNFVKGNIYKKINGIEYHKDAKRIFNSICPKLHGGSIILLHNGGAQTSKVLSLLIEYAEKKGLKFVTISELLKVNARHSKSVL